MPLWEKALMVAVVAALIAVAALLIVTATGCNVYMSPNYQAKVQMSSDIIDEMVKQCPTADHNDCCAGLEEASRTIHLILDASYGKE